MYLAQQYWYKLPLCLDSTFWIPWNYTHYTMLLLITKKVLRETQTLRAGCSKAEPKIFAPPQTPFPGAKDGQSLTSWRWSLPSPTDQIWWISMHAISSYRDNRHRPPATNAVRPPAVRPPVRHRQDRLQYTAPLCLARIVITRKLVVQTSLVLLHSNIQSRSFFFFRYSAF